MQGAPVLCFAKCKSRLPPHPDKHEVTVIDGTFVIAGDLEYVKRMTNEHLYRTASKGSVLKLLISTWVVRLQEFVRYDGEGFTVFEREEEGREVALLLHAPGSPCCSVLHEERTRGLAFLRAIVAQKMKSKRHMTTLRAAIDMLDRFPVTIQFKISRALEKFLPQNMSEIQHWKWIVSESYINAYGVGLYLSEIIPTKLPLQRVMQLLDKETDIVYIPEDASRLVAIADIDTMERYGWIVHKNSITQEVTLVLMLDRGFLMDYAIQKLTKTPS